MMATICLKSLMALLLGAVEIFPLPRPGRNQNVTQNPAPVVVRIDKTPRGIVYRVDSQLVRPTATANLLYLLYRAGHERGSMVPVVVLVDPGVSFAEMWVVDGVAAKVPLNNIRYFVFSRDSRVMTELKWGPAQPPLDKSELGLR